MPAEQDIDGHSTEYMLNKSMTKNFQRKQWSKNPIGGVSGHAEDAPVTQSLFTKNTVKSQFNNFSIMHILSLAADAHMHANFPPLSLALLTSEVNHLSNLRVSVLG
jgi:hypothetical protein